MSFQGTSKLRNKALAIGAGLVITAGGMGLAGASPANAKVPTEGDPVPVRICNKPTSGPERSETILYSKGRTYTFASGHKRTAARTVKVINNYKGLHTTWTCSGAQDPWPDPPKQTNEK